MRSARASSGECLVSGHERQLQRLGAIAASALPLLPASTGFEYKTGLSTMATALGAHQRLFATV